MNHDQCIGSQDMGLVLKAKKGVFGGMFELMPMWVLKALSTLQTQPEQVQ